jgi:uncharacterized protein YeaO (DUF488 family)
VTVAVKRVYEPAAPADGYRVLVDRLWPRGLPRASARMDEWRRELAPSEHLRRWFGHDPALWPEFRARYRKELQAPGAQAALRELAMRPRRQRLTLLYGARDTRHNNAVVLHEVLAETVAPGARISLQEEG